MYKQLAPCSQVNYKVQYCYFIITLEFGELVNASRSYVQRLNLIAECARGEQDQEAPWTKDKPIDP